MVTLAPALPFAEPVLRGRLLRRYKRFFVDVDLDGVVHTAHTSNTGAMTGLLVEGAPVVLTRHNSKTRALPLELEAIGLEETFVAVNTIRANRVAAALVRAGVFPELGTQVTATEHRIGDSRVDLVVDDGLVEVKSVTLRLGGAGAFPDAVSARATKHAGLLQREVAGRPAAILFLVQRTDVDQVVPADAVDPAYGAALRAAAAAGVKLVAASVALVQEGDTAGLALDRRLPVRLP